MKSENSEMTKPIYCDNCRTLAVAKMDGVPLCVGCLICYLGTNSGKQTMEQIEPLNLRVPENANPSTRTHLRCVVD